MVASGAGEACERCSAIVGVADKLDEPHLHEFVNRLMGGLTRNAEPASKLCGAGPIAIQCGEQRRVRHGQAGIPSLGEPAEQGRLEPSESVDRLNVEPGDRVLDIGSGPGLALEAATRRGAAEIAGVDHSELAVRVARRRLHRVKQTPARVERAEAGSLPFPDESFDKILSVNGISPGGGLDEALREAFRVLSPGGTLLLVVRARREGATSTRRLDRSARFGASAEQIATLVRAIEAAGFTNVASALQEVSGEMMSAIAAKKGP
jgi:SAM-dependent methyltransferase